MINCTVEMFGIPSKITARKQIELGLDNGASVDNLVAGLRAKAPELDGSVILAGSNRLTDEYGFYINGSFYTGENEVKLQNGDRVVILLLATGG